MMQILASSYVRLMMPVIIIGVIWMWIRWRKNKKTKEIIREDNIDDPVLEKTLMDRSTISSIKKSNLNLTKTWLSKNNDLLSCMENMEIRSLEYRVANELVGVILYAWPSSLWKYRTERKDLEHTSYSHIFVVEVDPEYRKQGLAESMFDEIIKETKKISSGITIVSDWKDLTKVCKDKFGFTEYSKNKYVLDYGGRS